MYRQAHFSFQVSEKLQLRDLWNKRWAPWKHKLTLRLTRFCVPVLMLVVMSFRHRLHGLHPPLCLRPCQIYSYPQRLLSGIWSGSLQSHLEYWLYSFSLSSLRETARGRVWEVAHWRRIQWNSHSHTHLYTPNISSWDHWVAVLCLFRVCSSELTAVATLDQQSQLVPILNPVFTITFSFWS